MLCVEKVVADSNFTGKKVFVEKYMVSLLAFSGSKTTTIASSSPTRAVPLISAF